jgi:hypothetical protein
LWERDNSSRHHLPMMMELKLENKLSLPEYNFHHKMHCFQFGIVFDSQIPVQISEVLPQGTRCMMETKIK